MHKHIRIFISAVLFLAVVSGIQSQTEPEKKEEKPEEKKEVVEQQLDEVSITATRVARKTQEVPASITVVGKDTIEDARMVNIQDALSGTPGLQVESKNGGYDSRLIIRGAGVKARYGIREIMVLLNGVPITDPDGFSKLDLLDPQQIEQIEVVKGPNSTLWGANAAGGVINIITRSPLKEKGGFVKVGGGNFGSQNSAFSYASNIDNFFMYMLSGSLLASDNTWRERNKYRGGNVAFQPSFVFSDGTTWENFFSYNKSDLQLPGTTDEVLYEDYLRTGDLKINPERKYFLRQMDANIQTGLRSIINPNTREDAWKYSGRYSDSGFFSSKLTKKIGDLEIKPLVYANRWTHNHPVTGMINDSGSTIYGGDLQLNWDHHFGVLTVGGTGRVDHQNGRGYQYRDITTDRRSGRVTAVTSDAKGDEASISSSTTRLAGGYLQEALKLLNKRLLVDLGIRYDEILFKLNGRINSYYDWSAGKYLNCKIDILTECGQPVNYTTYNVRKIYEAPSPRIGISFKIIPQLSIFGNAARGIQTPTTGEITSNPNLEMVKVTSYEGGFKGRGKGWSFDLATYENILFNEVVPRLNLDSKTEYANAGKTHKRGFEAEGSIVFAEVFSIGAGYARTKYVYDRYIEVGTDPYTRKTVQYDRGNYHLPYIPSHQHTVFLQYKKKGGFKARIQAETWGPYFIDTANTEKYREVKNITTLMLGYQIEEKLDFTFNVRNLFDRRYAVEVTKDPSRGNYYSVAAPRTVSFALTARF